MWTQFLSRHLTRHLLLLTTILPTRLKGTSTTTVILTITQTVVEDATGTHTLNATLPSYLTANTTRIYDPSAVQGDIPHTTSTTCAHSMTHFVPPTFELTLTKLTSPPMTHVHESLDGSMSIQTINLPFSGAPHMPPADVNEGDNPSTATTTATRGENVIAWSYMDPQDTRLSVLTEVFDKPAKRPWYQMMAQVRSLP
ncbi:hypothetical protein P171DRAFT_472399 [Karstenula rhodostoma CBS 690.94]|uniref:Uncharacterized protein n=1 Tax=Karstenula rhodostoma CBS 690.94 TaxID=1392251 RepID=A0A9P4PK81_9PLEO|nr:hypothetical protein P171DRAFT_472399 [Karstenula rhodostoma CBS 690.94]